MGKGTAKTVPFRDLQGAERPRNGPRIRSIRDLNEGGSSVFYPGEAVFYEGEMYQVLGSPLIGAGGLRYTLLARGRLLHGVSEKDLNFAELFPSAEAGALSLN
jgi:hypothetical protein